jgi:hypothetical protein
VLLLAAKLAIAPSFVALVTLLGRRLGPTVAGFLASFPVVGGPILALLVVEQGLPFGETAALGGAVGAASTMVFALAYARASRAFAWRGATTLAYLAYFAVAGLLLFVPATPLYALLVPLVTWAVSLATFPRARASLAPRTPSRWDLPMRVVATMALVFSITTVARTLGPERSGLLTPFPIATAVLGAFTHRELGSDAAVSLLRALCRGLASYTAFFLVVGLVLVRLGLVGGFVAGLSVALLVHAVLHGVAQRATLALVEDAR